MITELGRGSALEVQIDHDAIAEKLTDVGQAVSPSGLHHLLDVVGELVETQTKDRFVTTKTDPAGQPWVPWAESTREAYERTGNANFSLLQHGGRGSQHLWTSITHLVHDEDATVEVGTNVTYAAVHNYGANFSVVSTQHEVLLPQRQFLGVGDTDSLEIDRLVQQFVGDFL